MKKNVTRKKGIAVFALLICLCGLLTGCSMAKEEEGAKIEGDLAFMLSDAINFVVRNMKTSTTIDSNGKRHDKTEYPIKAIREIKNDMQKPHPMDRLLCGDVGFGVPSCDDACGHVDPGEERAAEQTLVSV